MKHKYPYPIDLQVNGYLGADFSAPGLTKEKVITAFEGIFGHGTGIFLPTITTSEISVYEKNLAILKDVIEMPDFRARIPGLHVEGPFISSEPGAVGAHIPEYVRPPSVDFLKQLQDWSGGHVKILTLAAELPGADKVAEYASDQGITVFLGHQNASLEDLKRLAGAGAKAITHLGNGMPNSVDRHNNIFFYGLAVDELSATIITDGHHLPSHLIQTILRAKGIERVIVISDASPIAGMRPGVYDIWGNKAMLEENGLLHNPEKKCMVGSSATIVECIDFLKKQNLLDEDGLSKVVYKNPLKLLNLKAEES